MSSTPTSDRRSRDVDERTRHRDGRRRRWLAPVTILVVLGIVAGSFYAVWTKLQSELFSPSCTATTSAGPATFSPEQVANAALIAAISDKRGLPPRAASIAMATVYQETGIRNLDYGDRDSVGLFQQRPSQGWGTEKQLMDPFYSTGKFYDALVKIDNWRTDDINDVAQKVQRSGHPEAYRDHEADARVLASALTGHSPAGFSCLDRTGAAGEPDGLARSLRRTFGKVETITDHDQATGVSKITIKADNTHDAWAYAHHAVANAKHYGVTGVKIADRQWQTQDFNLPEWTVTNPALPKRQVEITMR